MQWKSILSRGRDYAIKRRYYATGIVGNDRKLMMIECDPTAPLSHIEPGKKIKIGDQDGVVLFRRSGFYFATSISSSSMSSLRTWDTLLESSEEINLTGEDFHLNISNLELPWMRLQPQQMERQVIWEWLPTGSMMMDSLTPMGRGQSMLLVSNDMCTRASRRIMNQVSRAQTQFETNVARVHAQLDVTSCSDLNDVDFVVRNISSDIPLEH